MKSEVTNLNTSNSVLGLGSGFSTMLQPIMHKRHLRQLGFLSYSFFLNVPFLFPFLLWGGGGGEPYRLLHSKLSYVLLGRVYTGPQAKEVNLNNLLLSKLKENHQ